MAGHDREVRPPTVVRRDDVDLYANGNVWGGRERANCSNDAAHHRLRSRRDRSVTVTFRIEARLGFLVPYRMDETYSQVSGQRITSAATYSNFRRFETSGRLIEPKGP